MDISKNCKYPDASNRTKECTNVSFSFFTGLANIPESLKSCKKLQFLDIGDNAFEKLPDVITKLIHLEELYLNDSYLDFLPARFGGLTNLRILEVRHNKLITLPKSMARLTSLTRIDIGSNDFRELPEVIGCMINLKELLIDGNKISRISANVKNLKKLIHFEAGDNRLRSLPQEISNWTNVEVICLTKNDLENLPEAFGEMKSLVSLKLDDNELQELPSCIGNLTNLEEIMLSHNDLYCLPSSIGFLRKLKIFTCDENTLRELPDEISSCVSLKILSVRGNKLTVLPSNIGHLNNLTVMNIVNNFITHLPVSMWNLKLSALWISENQSKPLIPLQKEYFGGENYHLTCYMLPQEVYKKEHSTLPKYHPPTTTTTKHICFASDSIKPRDESFGLLRSPTPYPKELKTMASSARRLPVNNIDQPNPTIKEAKINNTIVLNYEDIDDHKTKLLSSPVPPPLPVRNYIWNEQTDYTDSRQIINEYINLPIQHFKSSQSSHINEFNDQIDYNWIEPNIELPQISQQPPPYHIAKAYTKKSKQDLLIYDSIRKSIRDDENNSVLSSSPLPSQTKNSSQLNVNVDSTTEFYDNSENNNLSVKLDDDEELMTEDEDVDTLIKILEENSEKPVCSPVQSESNSKPFRQQWMFGQHRNPTVVSVF